MRTFARIQDGRVAELVKTDGDITTMYHAALIWVDVSTQPELAEGWSFDGKKFIPPPEPLPAAPAPAPTIVELQAQIAVLSAQLDALAGTG